MEFRELGRSGLKIAPLMFGGNVFGWTADEKTSHTLLDAFVDGGFNAIDTADVYSRWVGGHTGGESEIIIGNWLKASGKRDKVVIATKVGGDMGEGKNLGKDYIIRRTEDCLKRLQIDCIDLMQSHWDDEKTPVEDTLAAYTLLVRQGKVKAIGASNLSPERLKASIEASESHRMPRYHTLQPNYNLYDRTAVERDYAPICRAASLSIIPYYALAAGFLTGKYRSAEDAAKNPARGARVKGYFDERGVRILEALDEVAARHSAKPAQIALAWLLAQPLVAAPIASATSVAQLQELMTAPRLKLSADDLKTLDTASA
jgi:aryl-alcohol dehydrogenase-like predicted oxidoreductase